MLQSILTSKKAPDLFKYFIWKIMYINHFSIYNITMKVIKMNDITNLIKHIISYKKIKKEKRSEAWETFQHNWDSRISELGLRIFILIIGLWFDPGSLSLRILLLFSLFLHQLSLQIMMPVSPFLRILFQEFFFNIASLAIFVWN